MTEPARAVLVSHGQPSDPQVAEGELANLAASVRDQLPDWRIASATLAAPGALENVMAAAGPGTLVYPVFMTHGWFIRSALPKRLDGTGARILPPLGTDPALARLAAAHLARALAERGVDAAAVRLIVAAHGSGRSPNAARDTALFADRLSALLTFRDLRLGFVEQPPFLAEALADAGDNAICLPFFAARRGHVLDDLPEAVTQSGFAGWMLDPVGLWPGMPALIADALTVAGRETTG